MDRLLQTQHQLAVAALQNRTKFALAYGTALIASLQADHPNVIQPLELRMHFTTSGENAVLSLAEILPELLTEAETLHEQRAALVADGERLLNKDLELFDAVDQELAIRPADTWNLVVAKAISLRQLGRLDDAQRAFAIYGEMFATTDETAKQYADDARQFTIHMERLGIVDGAVYLCAIAEDSPASCGGLHPRDILIGINAQPIRNMMEIQPALAQLPAGESATFEILRLNTQGIFQRQQVTLDSAKLFGLYIMPI